MSIVLVESTTHTTNNGFFVHFVRLLRSIEVQDKASWIQCSTAQSASLGHEPVSALVLPTGIIKNICLAEIEIELRKGIFGQKQPATTPTISDNIEIERLLQTASGAEVGVSWLGQKSCQPDLRTLLLYLHMKRADTRVRITTSFGFGLGSFMVSFRVGNLGPKIPSPPVRYQSSGASDETPAPKQRMTH